jgi:hypothetical protein
MSSNKESRSVRGEAVWKIGEMKVTLSETELESGNGRGRELFWVRRTATGRVMCDTKKFKISLSIDEEEPGIASADWMRITSEIFPLLRGFIAVATVRIFCCSRRA